MEITEYRLTLLGVIAVIILAGAAVITLNGPFQTYVTFAAPTLIALMTLFRAEQNAKQQRKLHAENKKRRDQTEIKVDKLVGDNEAFRAALKELERPQASIQRAAKRALERMPPPPPVGPPPMPMEE